VTSWGIKRLKRLIDLFNSTQALRRLTLSNNAYDKNAHSVKPHAHEQISTFFLLIFAHTRELYFASINFRDSGEKRQRKRILFRAFVIVEMEHMSKNKELMERSTRGVLAELQVEDNSESEGERRSKTRPERYIFQDRKCQF